MKLKKPDWLSRVSSNFFFYFAASSAIQCDDKVNNKKKDKWKESEEKKKSNSISSGHLPWLNVLWWNKKWKYLAHQQLVRLFIDATKKVKVFFPVFSFFSAFHFFSFSLCVSVCALFFHFWFYFIFVRRGWCSQWPCGQYKNIIDGKIEVVTARTH